MGVQSAVKIVRVTPGSSVTRPSRSGSTGRNRPSPRFSRPTRATISVWVWPGKHRLLGGKAHGLPQDLVVSQHPLRLVAPVNAQIQAGQAPGAHAPQPGGEAMRRILEKPAPDILQSAPCYNFKFQSDSFPKRARSPAEAPCLSPEGIGAWRPAFQVLITRSPGRVQPPGPRGARGGAVMPVPQQCPCPGSIFCTFCHCRRGRGRWGLPFWPYAPAAASRSCRWR